MKARGGFPAEADHDEQSDHGCRTRRVRRAGGAVAVCGETGGLSHTTQVDRGIAVATLPTTCPLIAGLLAPTGLLQAVVLTTRNRTLREQPPADLHPVGYSIIYAGSGYGCGLSAPPGEGR